MMSHGVWRWVTKDNRKDEKKQAVCILWTEKPFLDKAGFYRCFKSNTRAKVTSASKAKKLAGHTLALGEKVFLGEGR